MRCMERNKQTFWYATLEKDEPVLDAAGFETGEHRLIYANPLSYKAPISPAIGEIVTRLFGLEESYDKLITVEKDHPPIDESTVLWVDRMPVIQGDGSTDTPHDYVVRKVAQGLDGAVYAIRKVIVNG